MKLEWRRAVKKLRRSLSPEFLTGDGGEGWDNWIEEEEDSGDFAQPIGEIDLVRSELRPQLFDYQQELVERFLVSEDQRTLLALPTGAGKTRTAVAAILAAIGNEQVQRVIWLAPTIELVDQAMLTFSELWLMYGEVERLRLSRLLATATEGPLVVLTTPQTVYARRTNPPIQETNSSWDLVIFDEAHQLGAPTFIDAVESLGIGSKSNHVGARASQMLGLSATPGRVDPDETEDLVSLFRGRLLRSSLLEPNPVEALQRRGVLAELRFRLLTESKVPLEDEGRRLLIAARACVGLVGRERRPLVFTSSVPGAIVLAEALCARGIRAAVVHSETGTSQRRKTVYDFGVGALDVLINQRLLATGYDCPAVSDVLILGRVGSPILFEQMVGRAARGPRTGGSRFATVWDFDGHLKIHGRPNSYYRYRDYDWRSVGGPKGG